jgi:hypothetical protein
MHPRVINRIIKLYHTHEVGLVYFFKVEEGVCVLVFVTIFVVVVTQMYECDAALSKNRYCSLLNQ